MGHDYGSSVATEIVARHNFGSDPIQLRSLTLCNGSMHIELANLRVAQRLLKAPRSIRYSSDFLANAYSATTCATCSSSVRFSRTTSTK